MDKRGYLPTCLHVCACLPACLHASLGAYQIICMPALSTYLRASFFDWPAYIEHQPLSLDTFCLSWIDSSFNSPGSFDHAISSSPSIESVSPAATINSRIDLGIDFERFSRFKLMLLLISSVSRDELNRSFVNFWMLPMTSELLMIVYDVIKDVHKTKMAAHKKSCKTWRRLRRREKRCENSLKERKKQHLMTSWLLRSKKGILY